jgi:hypothetical protein
MPEVAFGQLRAARVRAARGVASRATARRVRSAVARRQPTLTTRPGGQRAADGLSGWER